MRIFLLCLVLVMFTGCAGTVIEKDVTYYQPDGITIARVEHCRFSAQTVSKESNNLEGKFCGFSFSAAGTASESATVKSLGQIMSTVGPILEKYVQTQPIK